MLDIHPTLHSKILDCIVLYAKRVHALPESNIETFEIHWEQLAQKLSSMGLNKITADALISWLDHQSASNRKTNTKMRILHPMEREFVSGEAYGYILELHYYGLLTLDQVETMIENCASLSHLPAGVDEVQKMVIQLFFSDQTKFPAMGKPN